ncbi:MAG: CRTAC1 family protein [Bacteroidota bacterium]
MPSHLLMLFFLSLSHIFCSAQFVNYNEIWNLPTGSYNAFFGNGVSVFDYDGDNLDNITVAYPFIGISGFKVSNGQLISDFFVPLPLDIKQLIWGDFNNDGDKELFVTVYGGGLFLFDYTQNGLVLIENAFSSVILGFHYGASAADFDNDGDLDLFVTQYWNYNFTAPYSNLLFRNEGNFVFSEVGASLGVNAATNNSFQSVWVDFDQDGWQDLYVINDKNVPNLFYKNNFGISFSEISETNNSNIAMSCMSNSISDFDRDGFFDIFITDGLTPVLLKGESSGIFNEVAYEVGFMNFQTGWGALWIDDDLNGWDDIHICQGGTTLVAMPNQYYRNENGYFTLNNSFDLLFKASFVNSKGDFDGDCSPDFITMNSAPISYDIWKGLPSINNYIKLKLVGTVSNLDAAGSLIEVYCESGYTLKTITMGDNYISQNSNSLFFGIASDEVADSIIVTWPLGGVSKFFNVDANHFYQITEGSEILDDLFQIESNFSVCPEVENFEITPDQDWENWQWTNGEMNNSQWVNSDTTLFAQAWNGESQLFSLTFIVDFIQDAPAYNLVIDECDEVGSVLVIDHVDSWSANLNGVYIQNDSTFLAQGNYLLELINLNGCQEDTLLHVEFFNHPVISSGINLLCPETEAHYSIEIQNYDSTFFELEGLDFFSGYLPAGIYPFNLLSNEGCIYTDTLSIPHLYNPEIQLLNDTVCQFDFETNDFEIITADSNTWTLDNYVAAELPNEITFHFVDNEGCNFHYSDFVYLNTDMSVEIIEDTLSNYSILTAFPTGGTPPYQITWDNVFVSNQFEITSNQTVSYAIVDSLGCVISGFFTSAPIQSNLIENDRIALFYFDQDLYCEVCHNEPFELYNSEGKLIESGTFRSPFSLKNNLATGLYYLKIKNQIYKFYLNE